MFRVPDRWSKSQIAVLGYFVTGFVVRVPYTLDMVYWRIPNSKN